MKNSESPFGRLKKKLDSRRSKYKFRTLNVIQKVDSSRQINIEGKTFLNFSSNDYLDLSHHRLLKARSREYVDKFGTSSSSSRLITGTLNIHSELEEKLAFIYQKDDSLLFGTGFQANSTILPAITQKGDVIIADQLCHKSILTGCLASKANFYRYRHNDINHMETFLKRKSGQSFADTWIVTESLFSMDGDRAPLKQIIQLAKQYGAKIYVDDAHAFGVYGPEGFGYGAEYPEIDVLISTFGKAGGSFSAFVVSSEIIIETLINYCSGFIYSTAPPPSVIGAIDAALDLIPDLDTERQHLYKLIEYLHAELKRNDLQTSSDPSHILPVIVGNEEIVLSKSKKLKNEGMILTAIRPPTVPNNGSRFRISLTTAHQKKDCKKLIHHLLK